MKNLLYKTSQNTTTKKPKNSKKCNTAHISGIYNGSENMSIKVPLAFYKDFVKLYHSVNLLIRKCPFSGSDIKVFLYLYRQLVKYNNSL